MWREMPSHAFPSSSLLVSLMTDGAQLNAPAGRPARTYKEKSFYIIFICREPDTPFVQVTERVSLLLCCTVLLKRRNGVIGCIHRSRSHVMLCMLLMEMY